MSLQLRASSELFKQCFHSIIETIFKIRALHWFEYDLVTITRSSCDLRLSAVKRDRLFGWRARERVGIVELTAYSFKTPNRSTRYVIPQISNAKIKATHDRIAHH